MKPMLLIGYFEGLKPTVLEVMYWGLRSGAKPQLGIGTALIATKRHVSW
jgi:hypothetical protein